MFIQWQGQAVGDGNIRIQALLRQQFQHPVQGLLVDGGNVGFFAVGMAGHDQHLLDIANQTFFHQRLRRQPDLLFVAAGDGMAKEHHMAARKDQD